MSTKDEDDTVIWPVTDVQIDADELEAMGRVAGLAVPTSDSDIMIANYKPYISDPLVSDYDTNTVTIKGNMTISDVDGNNTVDVGESIRAMNERMLILQANFEAMEKYPALKDAYDQYKMLEKLLLKSNDDVEKD